MWFNPFSAAFGQYGSTSTSVLPSLITSKTLTVETLFSSDSSLMDLRFKGELVGRYLSRTPVLLHSLLKLLVYTPNEQDSKERQIRYPFMTGELFQMDMPFLIESLFEFSPQEDLKEDEEDFAEPKMVESFEIEKDQENKDNNMFINEGNNDQNEEQITKEEENSTSEPKLEKKLSEQDTQKAVIISEDTAQEEENPEIIIHEAKDQQQQDQETSLKGIKLLEFLLSFLQNPSPLNYTSAGYFSKAISAILSKKPTEVYTNKFLFFQILYISLLTMFSSIQMFALILLSIPI